MEPTTNTNTYMSTSSAPSGAYAGGPPLFLPGVSGPMGQSSAGGPATLAQLQRQQASVQQAAAQQMAMRGAAAPRAAPQHPLGLPPGTVPRMAWPAAAAAPSQQHPPVPVPAAPRTVPAPVGLARRGADVRALAALTSTAPQPPQTLPPEPRREAALRDFAPQWERLAVVEQLLTGERVAGAGGCTREQARAVRSAATQALRAVEAVSEHEAASSLTQLRAEDEKRAAEALSAVSRVAGNSLVAVEGVRRAEEARQSQVRWTEASIIKEAPTPVTCPGPSVPPAAAFSIV